MEKKVRHGAKAWHRGGSWRGRPATAGERLGGASFCRLRDGGLILFLRRQADRKKLKLRYLTARAALDITSEIDARVALPGEHPR
jgi:hypothetical protein